MEKLSVIVNSFYNNKKFLNNLFTETGNDFDIELEDNKIIYRNIDYEKTDMLFTLFAKCVVREFEKNILIKIINKNCDYLSKYDKYQIWKKAVQSLIDDETEDNRDYNLRIENVKNKLITYFSDSNTVSIEGFVNFRLQEFEEDLEDVVEECVQDYLLELEYLDFINMIKYFVSIQPSRYLAVEVIYDETVSLYADGKNITDECVRDFNIDAINYGINGDDFLLNSLISIAPKRVCIKQKNNVLNDEIKKTLLGVFGDKIKITTE